MKKILLLAAALILGSNLTINAANTSKTTLIEASTDAALLVQNDWERLGTRAVNMRADHDEILVTLKDGVFSKVKFIVRKAPIFIHNIKIVFGNGESKNVVINRSIPAGAESKVIDLPGNKRIIKKVVFNYKSVPTARGRGLIVLWGKH